jgi:nitrite reductase/ring-hydroxylating ferredoxin subunit
MTLPARAGASRFIVATAGEIPPGGRKIVDLDGISVGVFHVNGQYFALLNWCPHQAARLCEGKLWSALEGSVPGDYQTSRGGEVIACPWHGWEFDLRTGQSWCEPERLRVRAYDVRVEPATQTEIAAQTFPVSRDGEFIVVDLLRTVSE